MSDSARFLLVSLVSLCGLAGGCSSPKKIDVGEGCSLNSDCNPSLSCVYGKCHQACVETRDCPTGQSCVKTPSGNVCQLPPEADCRAAACAESQVCAVDQHCRTPCTVVATDCTAGQICAGGVCADALDLDPNGQLPQSGAGGTTGSTATSGGGATAATTGTTSSAAGAAGTGGSPSAGCGSANTTSPCGKSGTTCSLDVSGTARTYYVQLPNPYDPNRRYPVFFQFHPWGGSAELAMTMYGLKSKIPDAIYVSPQGLDAGNSGPGWANTNGQDIAFTKAMLADVQGQYCVDTTRVFSVGFSYGGMMSFAIGCEMDGAFRAIAPMAGSLYSDVGCAGTGHAVAMWGAHGTSDTTVPIKDGRAARDKILKQNHCGTDTTPVEPSPCVKYQGCDAGYDVTWCEWSGQHGMPSFGSSAIATFFKQFL